MEYWWCRKPDCCGAQAVRRRRQRAEEKRISLFAAPEGKDEGLRFLNLRGRIHREVGETRPGRDVIAERRRDSSIPDKSCRADGFFCGQLGQSAIKRSCYAMIAPKRALFCLSGLKNCTYLSSYDFSMIMEDKNGLSEAVR